MLLCSKLWKQCLNLFLSSSLLGVTLGWIYSIGTYTSMLWISQSNPHCWGRSLDTATLYPTSWCGSSYKSTRTTGSELNCWSVDHILPSCILPKHCSCVVAGISLVYSSHLSGLFPLVHCSGTCVHMYIHGIVVLCTHAYMYLHILYIYYTNQLFMCISLLCLAYTYVELVSITTCRWTWQNSVWCFQCVVCVCSLQCAACIFNLNMLCLQLRSYRNHTSDWPEFVACLPKIRTKTICGIFPEGLQLLRHMWYVLTKLIITVYVHNSTKSMYSIRCLSSIYTTTPISEPQSSCEPANSLISL